MRGGVLRLCCVLVLAACASSSPAQPGQNTSSQEAQLLCPELGGNVDPLEGSYADAPAANARIRAFVASARSLNDVTVAIERRAFDTCRRIASDLGVPLPPPIAPLEVQCAPLRTALAELVKAGIELRIAIAPPRCDGGGERKSRCDSAAAGGSPAEASVLCEAQAVAYARCTLPSVSFAVSSSSETAMKLGKSLEDNLPTMLYADMALGRRLVGHVEKVVEAGARLPNELKDAGPHGLACVGLGASVTTRAAERLRAFLALSAAIVLDLDPEVAAR